MNKILMTETEIKDIIEFEDRCGNNTLLQQIFSYNNTNVNVFKILDENGLMTDYLVEENIK
jgi:hypothetical protein